MPHTSKSELIGTGTHKHHVLRDKHGRFKASTSHDRSLLMPAAMQSTRLTPGKVTGATASTDVFEGWRRAADATRHGFSRARRVDGLARWLPLHARSNSCAKDPERRVPHSALEPVPYDTLSLSGDMQTE